MLVILAVYIHTQYVCHEVNVCVMCCDFMCGFQSYSP